MCTPIEYWFDFVQSSICASTWFVNELLMTKLGWPIAHPKFTKRPSASSIICLKYEGCDSIHYCKIKFVHVRFRNLTHTYLPFSNRYLSTCGFILIFSAAFFSSHVTSISQSKCPMLQTIASFGIFIKCRPITISLHPVVVTYIWPFVDASSIVVTWELRQRECDNDIFILYLIFLLLFNFTETY